ncbi:hypothetical protein Dvina_49270 [Dactylosporangium vinaceum]|uniref:Lipoprotein n=1 Tax=Dactylosporangium vinaceum TaxID=53362 RepID=A0ABV5LYJ4_9ACTN|nr:hypothetical protein [Dactylosporangium vinaceum]UAB95881.1 hypothetical protein Dvina_49270 [Dactylosporangium vinaceum]
MGARRLAAVFALTVAAGSALAGCRSQPDVAVYLGDRTVSTAEVDRIVKDVNAEADRRIADWGRKRAADPNLLPPPIVHTTGDEVVSLIVLADAGQRIIAERGLGTRTAPADTIAETFGLPPTDTYVQLWTRYLTGLQSVAAAELARPLTDDEADRLFEAGAADPDADYDEAVHTFKTNINLGPLFGAQRRFGDVLDAGTIAVNPQYGPVVMPVVMEGRHLAVDFPEHFEEG